MTDSSLIYAFCTSCEPEIAFDLHSYRKMSCSRLSRNLLLMTAKFRWLFSFHFQKMTGIIVCALNICESFFEDIGRAIFNLALGTIHALRQPVFWPFSGVSAVSINSTENQQKLPFFRPHLSSSLLT